MNLRPPLIFLVSIFLAEMTSYSQNTARIEILIIVSVENCTNTGAKVFVLFRANCCSNCYPCGIFENMTSFTPILKEELEQGKLMAALNSRK